jgi:predicted PurR-regulated permease PerM
LVYSAILTTNIDNFLKPTIISSKTKLHPVLVIIGVFGGLAVFGFIGLILGPIILAILIIFLQEYTIDFKSTLVQKEEAADTKLDEMAEKELEKEEKGEEKKERKQSKDAE